LPEGISGLRLVAASYTAAGQMTDCRVAELGADFTPLYIRGEALYLYFVAADWSAVSPILKL